MLRHVGDRRCTADVASALKQLLHTQVFRSFRPGASQFVSSASGKCLFEVWSLSGFPFPSGRFRTVHLDSNQPETMSPRPHPDTLNAPHRTFRQKKLYYVPHHIALDRPAKRRRRGRQLRGTEVGSSCVCFVTLAGGLTLHGRIPKSSCLNPQK